MQKLKNTARRYKMIISHKLKVIYIKITKVAGTSLEIALSRYCGADDIITTIMDTDEATRQSLKFRGPQNYMDPETQKKKFRSHIKAREIKTLVATDIWNDYLKIATIRCPYDMYISAYYFMVKGKIPFEQFITKYQRVHSHLYSLHNKEGKLLTDFLIRYEHLDEDIKTLETKIDCPGLLKTFQSINAKGNRRPEKGTSSAEMYSKYPNAKLIIDKRGYKAADKHEFFKTYWPEYKQTLEEAIKEP